MVTGTRPDLAFLVGMLSTFLSNPDQAHAQLPYQVLRFLRHPARLCFRRAPTDGTGFDIKMYVDASWGSDPNTSRSVSGYILQVNGNTVSWASKRQSCVAKSTCEAEYMACSYAVTHLIWAKRVLLDLSCPIATCVLATDNQAAIALVKDQKVNARTKHIAIHFHFVRERYLAGDFDIQHVASAENLADICTKSLPKPAFQALSTAIGLRGGTSSRHK